MISLQLIPDKEVDRLVIVLKKDLFPVLAMAVKHASQVVKDEWKNMIDDNSTSPKGWKDRYKMSIEIMPGNTNDGLSAIVGPQGRNEMFANFVETGIKKFPMLPGLLNGPHAKIFKEGKRKGQKYNIVYFRKGVPGTQHIDNMPEDMHEEIQASDKSVDKRMRVSGVGGRGSWADAKQKLNEKKYTKGYKSFDPKSVGDEKKDKEREAFKGMVHSGSSGHSSFGTFRMVTQDSKGWKYPGVKASPVFQILVEKMKPILRELMKKEVLEKSLKEDLGQALPK